MSRFPLVVVWSLGLALGSGVDSSQLSLCERRPWWLDLVGIGAAVVSCNKAACVLFLAGLVISPVPLGHHGGGEEEVEAELGRRQIWVVFLFFSSDDEMQMQRRYSDRKSVV